MAFGVCFLIGFGFLGVGRCGIWLGWFFWVGDLGICAETHGFFCFAIERIWCVVLPTLRIRFFCFGFSGFFLGMRSLDGSALAPLGVGFLEHLGSPFGTERGGACFGVGAFGASFLCVMERG